MPYLCEDCGNDDSFNAQQDLRVYETEQIYIDRDGEVQDYRDSDRTDSEVIEGPYDIECSECNSGNVMWFDTDEELEERKQELEAELEEEKQEAEITTNNNWKKVIKGE